MNDGLLGLAHGGDVSVAATDVSGAASATAVIGTPVGGYTSVPSVPTSPALRLETVYHAWGQTARTWSTVGATTKPVPVRDESGLSPMVVTGTLPALRLGLARFTGHYTSGAGTEFVRLKWWLNGWNLAPVHNPRGAVGGITECGWIGWKPNTGNRQQHYSETLLILPPGPFTLEARTNTVGGTSAQTWYERLLVLEVYAP